MGLEKTINGIVGIKESDTGLSAPANWDLVHDKQVMQEEQPLQVARCTKIINPETEDAKYIINLRQYAKFVVALGDKVAPTDIEEGMRVGVDRQKYSIQIPLPPRIDPTVTMMTVEEKPDVTYKDVGGCKEQIEKLREVVEMPLLNPDRFLQLGIDPPKGVLLYGPPGTGKTPSARARGWCASCFSWRAAKRRASFSLTRWTRLAEPALTTAPAATMRCSGPCWS